MSTNSPPPGHIVLGGDKNRLYLLPHPGLQSIIAHYTICTPSGQTDDPAPGGLIHIVPDACGCVVCSLVDGQLKLLYWGPTSRAVGLENDLERVPLRFFVEFKHCGAFALLGRPLDEFRDKRAKLDELDPDLDRQIRICFEQAGMVPALFAHALDQLFLSRLRGQASGLAHYLLREIAGSQGTISVNNLARQTGYSPRHLNRISSQYLGLNLKLVARIFRINAVVDLLHRQPQRNLTELAHLLDYHDQPHFIHDFTDICGTSPGHYQKAMSSFYNEQIKFSLS